MMKQNKAKVLIVYLIAFFGLWALAELVVFGKINAVVENKLLSSVITELIKILVWTVPAAILINRFKDVIYISLKEMFSTKVN